MALCPCRALFAPFCCCCCRCLCCCCRRWLIWCAICCCLLLPTIEPRRHFIPRNPCIIVTVHIRHGKAQHTHSDTDTHRHTRAQTQAPAPSHTQSLTHSLFTRLNSIKKCKRKRNPWVNSCPHVSVRSTLFRNKLGRLSRSPSALSFSISVKSTSTCHVQNRAIPALRTYALSGDPRLSLCCCCSTLRRIALHVRQHRIALKWVSPCLSWISDHISGAKPLNYTKWEQDMKPGSNV